MDDSSSVLNALQAQLGPETIQRMSTQLGTDTAATSNAISMALPILLGGLSKNAANAEGAAALDNALTAHDGGILPFHPPQHTHDERCKHHQKLGYLLGVHSGRASHTLLHRSAA